MSEQAFLPQHVNKSLLFLPSLIIPQQSNHLDQSNHVPLRFEVVE